MVGGGAASVTDRSGNNLRAPAACSAPPAGPPHSAAQGPPSSSKALSVQPQREARGLTCDSPTRKDSQPGRAHLGPCPPSRTGPTAEGATSPPQGQYWSWGHGVSRPRGSLRPTPQPPPHAGRAHILASVSAAWPGAAVSRSQLTREGKVPVCSADILAGEGGGEGRPLPISPADPPELKGHSDTWQGPGQRPLSGFGCPEGACGDNELPPGKELQKHRFWGLCPEMTPNPRRGASHCLSTPRGTDALGGSQETETPLRRARCGRRAQKPRLWRSGRRKAAAREGLPPCPGDAARPPPAPALTWTPGLLFKVPSVRLWWGSAACRQPGPCLFLVVPWETHRGPCRAGPRAVGLCGMLSLP